MLRLSNASIPFLATGIVGLSLLAAAPSVAQTAAGAQAGGQSGNEPLPTGWFKVCSDQGENKICNTQFTKIADTRQLITAVNLINVTGKVNQKVIQAVVPTGRVIPAGVQIKVDTSAPSTLNYSVCFPDRCIAEAELTDAMVNAMKKGGELTVTSINFQRQANPVKLTLSGFTNAYDGEPRDQPALAQRQEELNSALQKQAEERRKKFEAAQNAAKESAGDSTSSQ